MYNYTNDSKPAVVQQRKNSDMTNETTTEIDITIYTEDESRVSVTEWDDGGAWLKIGVKSGGAYTSLTRAEAQQLMEGLQAILAKEVQV